MANDTAVATEVWKQLGGNIFGAMAGINRRTYSKDSLTMYGPKRDGWNNRATCLRVTLRPDDTYDVEFLRVYGTKVTDISKHEGVYNSDLKQLFETETGFDTHL